MSTRVQVPRTGDASNFHLGVFGQKSPSGVQERRPGKGFEGLCPQKLKQFASIVFCQFHLEERWGIWMCKLREELNAISSAYRCEFNGRRL